MSSDQLQNEINKMSLVFQQDADLAMAMKKAELHPSLAKEILKMHGSQREMEKALNELRTNMIMMARLLEQATDTQVQYQTALMKMAKSIGLGKDELVAPDKEG